MASPLWLIVTAVLVVQVAGLPIERHEPGQGSEYNDGLFEGDIKLTESQQKNGLVANTNLWRYRTIYYEISEEFTAEEKQMILEGINEYHRKTCIKLLPRPTGADLPTWMQELEYLWITRDDTGCWSYVGRLGEPKKQQLNLQSPGCLSRGTIIHEIMHAVGFYHEQSRPDRAGFVTINWDNIPRDKRHNFDTYGWDLVTVLDEPYDYESVMHYDAYAFADDRSVPTIIPKLTSAKLGQRLDFSKSDVVKINRRYMCT